MLKNFSGLFVTLKSMDLDLPQLNFAFAHWAFFCAVIYVSNSRDHFANTDLKKLERNSFQKLPAILPYLVNSI